jgi:thiamine-phosphate pyrophosphorylase
MKLSIITNPYTIKNEIGMINRFLAEGLDEIQIRKPKYDAAEMKKFIDKIEPEFHGRIVLHTHYSMVNHFDIDRIHLGHDWMFNPVSDLYLNKMVLKGKKVTKSMTITDCQMLYKPVSATIDEFMLGPVFARFSYFKENQLIKSSELEPALRHSKLPVIALGGVSTQTLEFFKTSGFSGIAMQGSIWKSTDPVASFVEIRDHYEASRRKLRIAV